MHPIPATLAAAGLLAVGGASGAALTAGPDVAPPAERRPGPVEVRTVVVHRTVRVVRHIRPKRTSPPPAAAAPTAAAPAQRVAAARVAQPAPRTVKPLRTRSSATGGGHGGEHESEGEDD